MSARDDVSSWMNSTSARTYKGMGDHHVFYVDGEEVRGKTHQNPSETVKAKTKDSRLMQAKVKRTVKLEAEPEKSAQERILGTREVRKINGKCELVCKKWSKPEQMLKTDNTLIEIGDLRNGARARIIEAGLEKTGRLVRDPINRPSNKNCHGQQASQGSSDNTSVGVQQFWKDNVETATSPSHSAESSRYQASFTDSGYGASAGNSDTSSVNSHHNNEPVRSIRHLRSTQSRSPSFEDSELLHDGSQKVPRRQWKIQADDFRDFRAPSIHSDRSSIPLHIHYPKRRDQQDHAKDEVQNHCPDSLDDRVEVYEDDQTSIYLLSERGKGFVSNPNRSRKLRHPSSEVSPSFGSVVDSAQSNDSGSTKLSMRSATNVPRPQPIDAGDKGGDSVFSRNSGHPSRISSPLRIPEGINMGQHHASKTYSQRNNFNYHQDGQSPCDTNETTLVDSNGHAPQDFNFRSASLRRREARHSGRS